METIINETEWNYKTLNEFYYKVKGVYTRIVRKKGSGTRKNSFVDYKIGAQRLRINTRYHSLSSGGGFYEISFFVIRTHVTCEKY